MHATASMALLSTASIIDGASLASWEFSRSVQKRLSFEKTIGELTSLSLNAAFAPLVADYARLGLAATPSPSCPVRCDANADLWTFSAGVHVGGGPGFHHVLETGIGVSFFRNFRVASTGEKLAPFKADGDLTITVGYGVGYTVGQLLEVRLVQDIGLMLHGRSGADGSQNDINQILVTRLAVRKGIVR
jgi:hypothetical protein